MPPHRYSCLLKGPIRVPSIGVPCLPIDRVAMPPYRYSCLLKGPIGVPCRPIATPASSLPTPPTVYSLGSSPMLPSALTTELRAMVGLASCMRRQ